MVDGKVYSMWESIVERKQQFIGKTLKEYDDRTDQVFQTTVVDITLTPNGTDSVYFKVVGKDGSCGFDVEYGGISEHNGVIGFQSTFGNRFCIV